MDRKKCMELYVQNGMHKMSFIERDAFYEMYKLKLKFALNQRHRNRLIYIMHNAEKGI